MHVLTRNSRTWVPVFSLLLCSVPAPSQAPLTHIADGVLGHFIGTWNISGTTLGKPTTTGAQIQEDFNGSFLEVRIKDPAGKDRYEARLFFGEKQDGGLVVHWLDGTGAETSQTLGTGSVAGDVVTLIFPYPEGTFRDKLTTTPLATGGDYSSRWGHSITPRSSLIGTLTEADQNILSEQGWITPAKRRSGQ